MSEQEPNVFTYKLGFGVAMILIWTLASMATGFVVGTIYARPTMQIANYNADGVFTEVPNTEPVVVPEVKEPRHRRKR